MTSIARASAVMAVGTTASRLTGFVRTAAIGAAIGAAGSSLADAYNAANTLPNVVYDLLLGGILTSVVVPVLVRATREDDDGGDAFASNLLTLVTLALSVVALVAVLAAPEIVGAYLGSADAHTRHQAVEFARWFLPQLVFYGVSATAGSVLNARGHFTMPMATPVLNNVVVLGTVVLYFEGGHSLRVLEVGTTLGVVVMTLALVPALRSVGLTWPLGARTPDLGHPGLRQAARLAGWGLVYVVISQLGFLIVTNLSSAKGVVGLSTYANAYQLFQLPYAIVGVSVVTALLPTLAGHHAAQRQDLARRDLARALRLAGALVIPGSVLLVALSGPIAVLTFAHGRTSPHEAAQIGNVLALLAVGLVPFTIQQSLLRALYAEGDSKTAALLGGITTGVLVAVDLVIAHEQTGPDRVVGLAGGFTIAWTIGALVTIRVLRRRLGTDGRETYLTVRLGVRALVASLLGAVVVVGLRAGVSAGLPGSGPLVATAQLLVAGTAGGVVVIRAMKRMQVHELDPLLRRIPGTTVILGPTDRLNPRPSRADIH